MKPKPEPVAKMRALPIAVAALALASPATAQTTTCFSLGSGGGITMLVCDPPSPPPVQGLLPLPSVPLPQPGESPFFDDYMKSQGYIKQKHLDGHVEWVFIR